MIKRRIVLMDPSGVVVREMDISDIDNADVRATFSIEIQTQCDMLHWHDGQMIMTVPWGQRLVNPYLAARDG